VQRGERETARSEVPEPLRHDVRLLGGLLGRVLAEDGGPELLEDVERLRRAVIEARESERAEREAEELIAAWPLERAEQVARAFTCYFHLANLAEEAHRSRALRRRAGSSPPDALATTVAELRAERGDAELRALLHDLSVHPVLTAHPTEARRRAVTAAIRRIAQQLAQRHDGTAATDRDDADRQLLEEVDVLWRTAALRSTPLRPQDEVRAALAVFDESLFEVVPALYRALDTALSPEDAGLRPPLAPAFLRFGSWVGGDRDGNPFVTAAVTEETMRVQAEEALRVHERAAQGLARELTVDAGSTPPSAALARRLEEARATDPERFARLVEHTGDEPHRRFLLHVADRLAATRREDPRLGYGGPAEVLQDLTVLRDSLASAGALRLAYGSLQHVLWQVETFGFHLAELEVREHSRRLGRALADVRGGGDHAADTREVLATFRAIADVQRRHGLDACSRYVVSFARDAGDVAAVYELAAAAGCEPPPVLDVVPLFETASDLTRATTVLDGMLELPPVLARLRETGRRLEVMLGYSDSAKEMGPVAAALALYDAQAELAGWAARRDVCLTIFHGRGGALGRGGGPANRAVLAQAPGSVAGRFKVTEQGEVVFARYGNPAIARRHLEQVTSAVLQASAPGASERTARAAARFRPLAGRIGEAAREAYRSLVDNPGFADWFRMVSPLEELGGMRIGSRPSRRGSAGTLDELRAIPWVFAWSQMRLNLPGWYGLGAGLEAADLDELRHAYAEWPLFTSLLDNAEMSLAKTDRRIAERYLALADRPDLSARLLDEYDRATARVLAVTGHRRLLESRRVLSWAVELRNPYVDALSHLQLRALRELRQGGVDGEDRARLERLLLLTVNGVAAGLQNTG
jgi:phosphoenolpyruvate carboxylase